MRNKLKRKEKPALCLRLKRTPFVLPVLLLFLLSPFANVLYSMAVMSVYSKMNENESLLKKENIKLHIPGGLSTIQPDWYPFVMTFTADDGFRSYTGNSSLSLTILYNFASFSGLRGCSRLYDTASPYYNSFYGAYLVQDAEGNPYGFQSGHPDAAAIGLVPEYDFFVLVLSEFGLTGKNAVFDFEVTGMKEDVTFAGEDGFFCMDAKLMVNGASHAYQGFTQSYLQYGKPRFSSENPLAPVSMAGRIYGKYLSEKNTSLFFYIVAADREVLEECDRKILSKSSLTLSGKK